MYSTVVRQFIWPSIKWKMRAYNVEKARMSLAALVPDSVRREELMGLLLREAGLADVHDG